MRSLWVISVALLSVVGCSNACPAAGLCSEPHPDYCPCLVDDASVPRPDAFVAPDAFAGDDAGADDAGELDADVDAGVDASSGIDAGAAADAGADAP